MDLILANATAPLQAAVSATGDIPILGTSITDYATALGMKDWNGTTGINVSGTSDLAPLDGQAAIIKELFPDAKNIGLVYCSAEANSIYQITVIKGYLEEMGYACTEFAFTDSNDVASVTQSAADASDVIYIPTDNTAAAYTETIANVLHSGEGAGRRGRGRHLPRLRRGDPDHQLLRSGLQDRRNGGGYPPERRGREHDGRLNPLRASRRNTTPRTPRRSA